MAPRRPPPRLEELGPRVLPSVTPFAVPAPLAPEAVVQTSAAPAHKLVGHGTYTTDPGPPDAGTTYRFTGKAESAGGAQVELTGSLTSVGFTANGRAHGFFTFSKGKDSITVEIFGPPRRGDAGLPDHYNFAVVGHTGAFAHLSGKGALRLTVAHGTFSLAVQTFSPGSR